ncbi:MAG: hypothetical protein CMP11_06260 [Zetaproteobacteria bacterium]|nr:hypothetical protein [Pseudobdellovibrionaceae bacterium]|tara:strand:- start:182 stop:718 length:537 start_codon:yes stop_codon:yes gene_type:complete
MIQVKKYSQLVFVLVSLFSSSFVSAELANKKFFQKYPGSFYLSSGSFNISRQNVGTNLQAEYRFFYPFFDKEGFYLEPLVGLLATSQYSVYAYSGLTLSLDLPKSLRLGFGLAPGLYLKGHGQDLGFPLEFKTSAELSYGFSNGFRFGGMFYDLSNAGLMKKDPGLRTFVFFFALPVS